MVADRSSGRTRPRAGYAPIRSEEPYTWPPLTPPPASLTENTEPQWPRPPFPSRRGVRPNSAMHTTSVSSSSPRRSKSSSNLDSVSPRIHSGVQEPGIKSSPQEPGILARPDTPIGVEDSVWEEVQTPTLSRTGRIP